MFEKKYDIKNLYVGYIVSVLKIDCLNNNDNVVTFCKIKDSIFYKRKNEKYLDLFSKVEYNSLKFYTNPGDIVFNEETKVNLEQYFIEKGIGYKEKMTLNEIETLILDKYNKNEETNNTSFQRKRK